MLMRDATHRHLQESLWRPTEVTHFSKRGGNHHGFVVGHRGWGLSANRSGEVFLDQAASVRMAGRTTERGGPSRRILNVCPSGRTSSGQPPRPLGAAPLPAPSPSRLPGSASPSPAHG